MKWTRREDIEKEQLANSNWQLAKLQVIAVKARLNEQNRTNEKIQRGWD
jgi:hypothetical protein